MGYTLYPIPNQGINMNLNNKDVVSGIKSLNKATETFIKTIADIQVACPHSKLAECEYDPGGAFASALPPMRMCLDCGITEEGWGCGYIVLTDIDKEPELQDISRDEILRLRIGKFIAAEYKGPLLRKEVTLEETIINQNYWVRK